MGINVEEFLELDTACRVSDLVADDGIRELSNQIHEGLAVADCEGDVARTAAGLDDDGREGCQSQRVVGDGVDVDFIGAQVGDEDELLGRIQQGLVRVRGVLSVGNRPRLVHVVLFRLHKRQVGRVGDVPGCQGTGTTTNKQTC